MRDYGMVSPRFWIGETGKQLRGDPEAQVLALYLMTSPHSTMTGVFHCPILYMAHETGLGFEGASKALARLSEAGFCEYDDASETIFVVRMAAYQIGESLKPSDNRVSGLRREVSKMPENRMKSRFLAVYGDAFCLAGEQKKQEPLASPFEAPPKPRTGTGTGTGTRKGRGLPDKPADVPDSVWLDFLAIRKAKRAPLTDTALAGIEKQARAAGMDLAAALAMCCERGWQGFDAGWVSGHASGKGSGSLAARQSEPWAGAL